MPAPMIRRDLESLYRQGPHSTSADGLALNATCHPGVPLRVYYRDGVLAMKCNICRETIAKISVAAVLLSSEMH